MSSGSADPYPSLSHNVVYPTLWYIAAATAAGPLIAGLGGLWRRRVGMGDALDDLFRQLQVGLGAAGVRIVQQRGLAVAGRLGESNVARDGGLAHQVAEEAAQLGGHRLRQV